MDIKLLSRKNKMNKVLKYVDDVEIIKQIGKGVNGKVYA